MTTFVGATTVTPRPVPAVDPIQAEMAALRTTQAKRGLPDWAQAILALVALYCFVVAINLTGHGMSTIAQVPSSDTWLKQNVFALATHPLAGLCVGILITALIHSSGFTTTTTVALVAAGQLTLEMAVPIIMGANIGTSVTSVLVSLAHLKKRREFRRSFTVALSDDFLNILCVAVLVPLQLAFGFLSRPAAACAHWLAGSGVKTANPDDFQFIKTLVGPAMKGADHLCMKTLGLSLTVGGAVEAALGLVLLFSSLILLVKMLQGLVKDRLAGLFNKTFFRNAALSFAVGFVATVAVQSSSVTISLTVPLVGAGILTLRQVFPYILGANIATTVTALLAGLSIVAMSAGQSEPVRAMAVSGLALAFAHAIFNIVGTAIWWPLQWVPLSLAKAFGKLAYRRRFIAGIYIVVVFVIMPLFVIWLFKP